MNNIIKLSVSIALAVMASGNLKKTVTQIRKAQFELIQMSKASKWPKALRLEDK